MTPSDKILDEAERDVPALMIEAGAKAYRDALASGATVLTDEVLPDGRHVLVSVMPDGSKRILNALEPRLSVTIGQRLQIR